MLSDLLETRESLTGTRQTFLIVTERMGSSYHNAEETGGEAGKKRYNWEYFRKNFTIDDVRGVLVNAWEKMVRESGMSLTGRSLHPCW